MNFFLFTKFQTKDQVEILFRILILFIVNKLLTISISGKRKLITTWFLFIARENTRAKIRLAFCGQLSPVSVNEKSAGKKRNFCLFRALLRIILTYLCIWYIFTLTLQRHYVTFLYQRAFITLFLRLTVSWSS